MTDLAWLDGIAIYVACLIVAVFAALIDWHKEKEFVKRSQEGDADESFKYVSLLVRKPFYGRYMFENLIAN